MLACLRACLFVCLLVCLFVCLGACLFVCLSVLLVCFVLCVCFFFCSPEVSRTHPPDPIGHHLRVGICFCLPKPLEPASGLRRQTVRASLSQSLCLLFVFFLFFLFLVDHISVLFSRGSLSSSYSSWCFVCFVVVILSFVKTFVCLFILSFCFEWMNDWLLAGGGTWMKFLGLEGISAGALSQKPPLQRWGCSARPNELY